MATTAAEASAGQVTPKLIFGRFGFWLFMVGLVVILTGLLLGYDQGHLRRARVHRQGLPSQHGIMNTTTSSAPAPPGGTGTPDHVLAPRRRTWARRAGT